MINKASKSSSSTIASFSLYKRFIKDFKKTYLYTSLFQQFVEKHFDNHLKSTLISYFFIDR